MSTKRINNKVREGAALICGVAASYLGELGPYPFYFMIGPALAVPGEAQDLAGDAWTYVMRDRTEWTREVDAEAEALLRTGWVPS